MFNLLIVDDEADIADSLFMHFKQMEAMETDVYKAYSADEALECMNRTKIDIVLSDIRMPGMNGLQLLEAIKLKWPRCRVIFLTGYNEFEYIYTATKTEGVKYLLKTEGYDEITAVVQKTIKELENSIEINELVDKAKAQMSQALPLLQKELLIDMLNGIKLPVQEKKQQFEGLKIRLDASEPVLLLLGRIDNSTSGKASSEQSQIIFTIRLVAEQFLSIKNEIFFVFYDHSTLLWLIQPKVNPAHGNGVISIGEWEETVLYTKGMLEGIQDACEEAVKLTLSFVIDNIPTEWDEISGRFNQLQQLLGYRIGAGVKGLVIDGGLSLDMTDDGLYNFEDANGFYLQMKKIRELGALLENGRRDEFLENLSELCRFLGMVESKNHNPALELYYSISIIFLSYINRWKLTDKIAFKIGLNKLTRADEHASWADSAEYFYQLANIIFDIQRNEENNRAEYAIKYIIEYVDAHLSEDLSLTRLSEQVHFNPSYLSRLFKQVTGNNLLNYISEVRLNKAKELLDDSSMKINEIATAVGYISATYFNRFFKNATNMTPVEYRERIIRK